MDTREGSGGRTFRHVVGEQLALGGQRRNLLRVALQRMVIDGAAVAARQDRSNGAEREGPLHSFLTMLIAPLVSSTAHFTSSNDSTPCCRRACSISSSGVSRSFFRLRSISLPSSTRITGSPSTTLRIRDHL